MGASGKAASDQMDAINGDLKEFGETRQVKAIKVGVIDEAHTGVSIVKGGKERL